jgi:hypothetical protein
MRVLLLHEMSGVHTELKDGLQKIGVDAKIATYGDGWKRFGSDFDIGSARNTLASNFERLLKQTSFIQEFKNFDVIQTISPNPFYRPIGALLERLAFSGNRKTIYVAAGSDAIYRKHVKDLEYFPPHDWFENSSKVDRLKSMLSHFDAIVPVCWEYKHCMQKAGLKTTNLMPFPINIDNKRVGKLGGFGKIKFFHPLNRDDYMRFDFKGTKIIMQAFSELSEKYKDVAEFSCSGGMSHDKYDALTDQMDVIVDQAYSFTYGMSAAYGLAKGKIVLSGLEQAAKDCDFYRNCPIINIKPNVEDIKDKIEYVLRNRDRLVEFSEESRSFAEKYHAHTNVAKQFLEIYCSTN